MAVRDELKELDVRPVPKMPSLYEIFFPAGGELPEMLGGKWSSRSDAQKAIKRFHESVKAKVIRRKVLKRAKDRTIEE